MSRSTTGVSTCAPSCAPAVKGTTLARATAAEPSSSDRETGGTMFIIRNVFYFPHACFRECPSRPTYSIRNHSSRWASCHLATRGAEVVFPESTLGSPDSLIGYEEACETKSHNPYENKYMRAKYIWALRFFQMIYRLWKSWWTVVVGCMSSTSRLSHINF